MSRNAVVGVVGIGAALLLVGGAVWLMLSRDSPGIEEVAREYLAAEAEGRDSDRCELATDGLRVELWGDRDCRLVEDSSRGTGASVRLGEVRPDLERGSAEVDYTLAEDGGERTGTLTLRLDGDLWLVSSDED